VFSFNVLSSQTLKNIETANKTAKTINNDFLLILFHLFLFITTTPKSWWAGLY